MKKIVLLLVLVFGIGVVGPKIIGGIVESEYENIAHKLSENPAIEITERSFVTNWFDGEAITKIKFKGNADELGNISLVIKEKLTFGPFALSDSGFYFGLAHSAAKLAIDAEIADEDVINKVNNLLAQKLSINSVLTYSFNYDTTAVLDEILYEADGNKAVIGKLYSESTLTNGKSFNGFIHWDGLNVESADKKLLIGAAKVDFDQEAIGGDFYSNTALFTGDFLILLKAISVKDADNNSLIAVDDLSFSGTSHINENLMDAKINYRIGLFVGQGQSLKNMNLDISFNKFDSKTMSELNQIFAQAQVNPNDMAQFTPQLITKASELLKNNPEVSINDFSVETPDGAIKSDVQLTVDNSLYDPNSPMSIIDALNVNAKGKAPLLYLTKMGLEGPINMYVEQGLLLLEEGKLSFSANFVKGQLTVNGNVIPL